MKTRTKKQGSRRRSSLPIYTKGHDEVIVGTIENIRRTAADYNMEIAELQKSRAHTPILDEIEAIKSSLRIISLMEELDDLASKEGDSHPNCATGLLGFVRK